jgi:hypothetical protein
MGPAAGDGFAAAACSLWWARGSRAAASAEPRRTALLPAGQLLLGLPALLTLTLPPSPPPHAAAPAAPPRLQPRPAAASALCCGSRA